jgi:Ca2+-binding RTX toxin-like protein
MIHRIPLRLTILGLSLLILISVVLAVAASNTVPGSRLASRSAAINANALKPVECAALNLSAIVICSGSGTCNGTAANELVIGTSLADTIRGRGGTDCIMGGGGDDDITGSAGSDVCIGGPGNDTFHTCETIIQ